MVDYSAHHLAGFIHRPQLCDFSLSAYLMYFYICHEATILSYEVAVCIQQDIIIILRLHNLRTHFYTV